MAYDYRKDLAWIEFESKDRVRRENEAREMREFRIFFLEATGISLTQDIFAMLNLGVKYTSVVLQS